MRFQPRLLQAALLIKALVPPERRSYPTRRACPLSVNTYLLLGYQGPRQILIMNKWTTMHLPGIIHQSPGGTWWSDRIRWQACRS
ncbi:hypothetical protein L211DRAFT_833162 [Terfezia boudieri ATCC MYA-4762]|uniref:Uncharacterized protein n=1 Tax=Terfezia boudieri ATCC MYA-4762 TaxID=1051890 RepID=A0A3N4MHQ5_9PEZI|nr:hypothetical protein L211DRAFT_833162 [Terfezia boudieri ATCC MYA-4762]